MKARDIPLVPARHPALSAAVLLTGLVFAVYAPALGRGFTSEDFLLIRFLGEHPPWQNIGSQFTEPWLGLQGIQFFRPVSTLLFGLEISAFGADPRGYVAVHLLVHALAAWLVWAIVRDLVKRSAPRNDRAGTVIPVTAAVLFALYPLHPNAVVFVASFATLFGGAFSLLAFHFYQRFRRGDGARWHAASLSAFALALGSYEAAAPVFAWIVAYDHLVLEGGRRDHARRIMGWLPYAVLLAVYFAWRHHLFGGFVGGYADTRHRLLNPVALGADALRSLAGLCAPPPDPSPAHPVFALAALAFVALPLLAFAFSREARRAAARPWILGWTIAMSSMAPFAFEPVVPANGRYWYLAAAGAAIGVSYLVMLPALVARPRWAGRFGALAGLLIAFHWAVGLAGAIGHTRRAADLARGIQSAIRRYHEEAANASGPLFVTGYPYFLTDARGVNLAQVYHYGLRDAAGPPFSPVRVTVFPLPTLAGADLLPIARAGVGHVLEWNESAARLDPVQPADVAIAEFDILPVPQPDSSRRKSSRRIRVRVPPGPHHRFRLLLSAPVNGTVVDLGTVPPADGILEADLPADFLQISQRLYGNGAYWWIDAHDLDGKLTGYSRMRPVARDGGTNGGTTF